MQRLSLVAAALAAVIAFSGAEVLAGPKKGCPPGLAKQGRCGKVGYRKHKVQPPRYTRWDAHYFPGSSLRTARLSEPSNYRDSPADPDPSRVAMIRSTGPVTSRAAAGGAAWPSMVGDAGWGWAAGSASPSALGRSASG